MRAPLLSAAALVLALPGFAADPAAPKKMKASFFGEGGGHKDSDPATDQYMQGELGALKPEPSAPSNQPEPAPAQKPVPAPVVSAPAAPAAPAASSSDSAQPVASVPASPRTGAPSRSSAGRPPAAERNAPVPGDARPAGRSSLWNGLVRPLEMKASDAAAGDDDSARAAGERDYETHILGGQAAPARPSLNETASSPAGSSALAAPGAAATAGSGKVFVSMELDPKEAGSLRDAVAGLGATTGFAADSRFEMIAGPAGRAMVSGWLPAGKLGEALLQPGVKRLRVETRARPSVPSETTAPFVVGLRVEDAAQARESVSVGVRALTSEAGFRLTRVIGVETAPDGRSVAIVAGTLPLSRLTKALSLPQVAKIVPAGGEPPAPASPASPVPAGGLQGFMKFAAERGPWLIVLTLLLALPSLRAPARRFAAVFSPYR